MDSAINLNPTSDLEILTQLTAGIVDATIALRLAHLLGAMNQLDKLGRNIGISTPDDPEKLERLASFYRLAFSIASTYASMLDYDIEIKKPNWMWLTSAGGIK